MSLLVAYGECSQLYFPLRSLVTERIYVRSGSKDSKHLGLESVLESPVY